MFLPNHAINAHSHSTHRTHSPERGGGCFCWPLMCWAARIWRWSIEHSTNYHASTLSSYQVISLRSFLWFPIPQWQNKTFCKFWYFDSGKGLKLLVTIIVTGNNKWFTSFCFLSWFRENEMWQNKTFWQNLKFWLFWCRGMYCNVLFSSKNISALASTRKDCLALFRAN